MRSSSTVVSLINDQHLSTFFHFDATNSVRLTDSRSVPKLRRVLSREISRGDPDVIWSYMEKKIAELKGKRIEVNCGNGVAFTGENLGIEDGVLTLEVDGKRHLFIDAAKVVVVSEAPDSAGKPGFIG